MSPHMHNNKKAKAKIRFRVKMTSNNIIFLYGDEKKSIVICLTVGYSSL